MWSIGASFLGFLQGSAEPPKALLSSGVSAQWEESVAVLAVVEVAQDHDRGAGWPASSVSVASWRRSASCRCAAALPWVLAGLWMLQTQIACPVVARRRSAGPGASRRPCR